MSGKPTPSEIQAYAMQVLDHVLSTDPSGESAFYATAFRRAVAVGAINDEGTVLVDWSREVPA